MTVGDERAQAAAHVDFAGGGRVGAIPDNADDLALDPGGLSRVAGELAGAGFHRGTHAASDVNPRVAIGIERSVVRRLFLNPAAAQ
jgi:hypothetical protein